MLKHIVRQILFDVADDPENSFEQLRQTQTGKKLLRLDINAEDSFQRLLHKYQKGRFASIQVLGEERLRNPDLNLRGRDGVLALVDAVDGTDLVERGLSNWCSGVVFFAPSNRKGKRILASCVAVPTNSMTPGEKPRMQVDVYCATPERVYVHTDGKTRDVHGCSTTEQMEQASLCFYEQKVSNFLSVAQSRLIRNLDVAGDFRIYNLGGIPMMLKLIDHFPRIRGVDAVVDLEGQKPHDVVPGAFIAKRAGAVLRDLSGKDIPLGKLEDLLLRPASPETQLTYILTGTSGLADQIVGLIRSPAL